MSIDQLNENHIVTTNILVVHMKLSTLICLLYNIFGALIRINDHLLSG